MPFDLRSSRWLLVLLILAGLMELRGVAGDDPSGGRVPWTTSKVVGSPDIPPPYRMELAFPRLKFRDPLWIGAVPGLDRMAVAELNGKIYSFPNRDDVANADLVVDLKAKIPTLAALYGVAFHPRFAENHQIYVCYVLRPDGPDGTHVARFTLSAIDPPQIDPASEQTVLTWYGGGHNGGCLEFGPDGMLYISAGDAGGPTPPDPLRTGQRLDDIPASLLRIDVDHAEPGKGYAVPADNPFRTLANARPEIWAFGFRNLWRFSFDRATGHLWGGDVGWELWEMVDLIERGGNYGWSITEGPQPVYPDAPRGPGPILPAVKAHPHSEAGSITGGVVYRGKKLPGLVGVYIYGDFSSGKVWGIRHDGQRLLWSGELANTPLQLVSFGADHDGEVYTLDFQRTHQIYRFVADATASTTASFPQTLSQTGLFADTRTQTPAPGVTPYAINAEVWADHATAERWLAVPGSGQLTTHATKPWRAPDGTVLARTISIERERGNPGTRQRLETQILHQEAGSWRPYTYVWDEAGTDATLADARGQTRTLLIHDRDVPGGSTEQTYRTFARSECVICHNPWVERGNTMFGRQTASPLALHTGQLNRSVATGAGPRDQLRVLRDLGLITGPEPKGAEPLPRLADPYDASADLTSRARSYLGVNCAHCHQLGAGGSANMFLAASLPIEQTLTLNASPMQGTFGIPGARLIAPGDPDGSVLYYRTAKLGGGRMPRLGSNLVDPAAIRLLHDWIKAMPGATNQPEPWAETGHNRLANPRSALPLMRAIDGGRLDRAATQAVLAEVQQTAGTEVKDLFERFIPTADRARRLGDAFDPAAVLLLPGNADRGAKLFAASSTLCASCHRVGGQGAGVGPDLDAIGARFDRAGLLRQIVEPSLTIEPKYVTQTLETRSGMVHSGVLVERSATEVVLRDARNSLIRVPAADVEALSPQSKSLMPEGLLRDLTGQQAADLLAYLGSLQGSGR